TRDDLYNHYRAHYIPNNAVASIVGDFDTKTMIARLEELFGTIPAGPTPRLFNRPEPQQQGERRVRIERPGPTQFLSVAYHVPEASHPDWIKLYMLDSILGGASGFGGGGVGNKTSRFYKALVRTELAASVGSGLLPSIDPYMYQIDVTLREGRTLEEVEAAVFAEIDKAINGAITQEELDKAKKQARALFAYSGETVTNQAFMLAYYEHVTGSYDWFLTFEERLRTITLEDVHEVAQKYLQPRQRTVGWFIPTEPAPDEEMVEE
ncbi:MAG: insulinase family protein, partial [Anaerolineae bacterium]|nr:insulinase family protein [Anaerolineae bacterium]